MRTITITTYPSMPGRFLVKHEEAGERPISRDARDAGEAAAVAINYAKGRGGSYVIVGIKAALDMIPEQVRYRE